MLNGHVEIVRGFHSNALHADDRTFRVYLPPDYDRSTESYPVVYMHDGQWCFGCESGKALTRQVDPLYMLDAVTDHLIINGDICPVILVAVDCDEKNRRKEMSHSTPIKARRMGRRGYIPCESFEGEGLGFQYQTFITDEIKPYVDQHYRTLPDRAHTMITGSSMGGLVSLRMGVYRSDVFGLMGLQSPAIHWETDEFYNQMRYTDSKIWIDCGTAESYYVDNTRFLVKLLLGLHYVCGKDFVYYLQPGAMHVGSYFGLRFGQMLKWFFGKPAKPISASIEARQNAAVAGHVTVLNTLVTYDNGVVLSDMDAVYSDTQNALHIDRTGEVHPLHEGETEIIYEKDGVRAVKPMQLVNALSEDVLVYVKAHVPEDTPRDDPIVFHFFRDQYVILNREKENTYTGFIGVPRDWSFDSHFTRCAENRDRKRECYGNGSEVERRVIAMEDQYLEYTIEKWKE